MDQTISKNTNRRQIIKYLIRSKCDAWKNLGRAGKHANIFPDLTVNSSKSDIQSSALLAVNKVKQLCIPKIPKDKAIDSPAVDEVLSAMLADYAENYVSGLRERLISNLILQTKV